MEIICEKINKEMLQQVYLLHKQKLGEGYLDYKHFEKLAGENKLLVAFEDGVVGYLTIDILKEDEFFISKRIPLKASSVEIVVFNTCASKYEKRGIGGLLFEFALKRFATNKKVYCPVWKCGENINAHKLLTRFGFARLITLEKFWYDESLNAQNFCPVCGSPCVCDNVIYLKKES